MNADGDPESEGETESKPDANAKPDGHADGRPPLKRDLAEGTPLGTWVSIGHPSVAEINARLGFEFLLIDTEHTVLGLETVENLVRGAEATAPEVAVVVRVPSGDPVRIKRVLDTGVDGLMVPMVESAAEAETIVDATRYPTAGRRGVASGRAAGYGADSPAYVETVGDDIVTMVQIETPAGLEAVEAIAATDVDALFVGPADLSANLGVFPDMDADRLETAVERVLAAGAATDTPVGTFTGGADGIDRWVDRGVDFLIAGKDTASLITAGEEIMAAHDDARRRE